MVASAPRERVDAARNRLAILSAAERMFAERGVGATSMEAIAVAAGVGKGTVFRRFGDRASLALAVLDRDERALQEAILHGPPPLGPGAPAAERLAAFGSALLDRLEAHSELMLAAELSGAGDGGRSMAHAVHWLHVRTLVESARPEADRDYLTYVLVAALSPRMFLHQRRASRMTLARLKAGYADLAVRMLAGTHGGSAARPEARRHEVRSGPGGGPRAESQSP